MSVILYLCLCTAVDSTTQLVSRTCVLIGLCDCGGAVSGVRSRPKRICWGVGQRQTGKNWVGLGGIVGNARMHGHNRGRWKFVNVSLKYSLTYAITTHHFNHKYTNWITIVVNI